MVMQKLRFEALALLARLRQGLSLCGNKCKQCFYLCVLEKTHPGEHTCMGTHMCLDMCSFCEEELAGETQECSYVSGHEGDHDCKVRNHACGQDCHLFEQSSNCNQHCSLRPRHEGLHSCNTKNHLCGSECSLLSCRNPCVVYLHTPHDRHYCHDKMCPADCSMEGCSRKCGVQDHFHPETSGSHMCGSNHTCNAECERVGNCEVVTEVVRTAKMYVGKQSTFEYEHVSEQNGIRKKCCIPIPPWKDRHDEPHIHTRNENAVHHCDVRCTGCGYFCTLPMNHHGLHSTSHGNMTNRRFGSESENIDIMERSRDVQHALQKFREGSHSSQNLRSCRLFGRRWSEW